MQTDNVKLAAEHGRLGDTEVALTRQTEELTVKGGVLAARQAALQTFIQVVETQRAEVKRYTEGVAQLRTLRELQLKAEALAQSLVQLQAQTKLYVDLCTVFKQYAVGRRLAFQAQALKQSIEIATTRHTKFAAQLVAIGQVLPELKRYRQLWEIRATLLCEAHFTQLKEAQQTHRCTVIETIGQLQPTLKRYLHFKQAQVALSQNQALRQGITQTQADLIDRRAAVEAQRVLIDEVFPRCATCGQQLPAHKH
jgi:hypothetical protein